MTEQEFVSKAHKEYFDDGSKAFETHKGVFIKKLKVIYCKYNSTLSENNMNTILMENGLFKSE